MAVQGNAAPSFKTGILTGLTAKVLWLVVIFVMLGEILIFMPSIANFRITWLKNRIALAEIAALAVEAAPDQMLSADLRSELLMGAGVRVVSLKQGDTRRLVLRGEGDHMIDAAFDLRDTGFLGPIRDAFGALLAGDGRVIGVTDKPPNMSGDLIEVALDEAPLRQAMLRFGLNILLLSIALSIIVASMIFVALNRMLVNPMQRLASNMLAFAENPEDSQRVIVPSARRDEIGLAERELQSMQQQLASLLQQKSRLAALGLAVSKVSHDLRNMLSSAHMISDRLATVNDPTVQKFAPKLIGSIDRAIDFCVQTLKFGRAQEPPPRREKFPLRRMVDDVIDGAVVSGDGRIILENTVPATLAADADRDQLIRVLTNLSRNAIQALESYHQTEGFSAPGLISLKAWREGAVVTIEVRDNGPGIPERVRPKLFEAFQSAARPGGTGLGLAIAAELIRAHGGEIRLADTGETGTAFWVVLPDRVAEVGPVRKQAG